MAAALPTLYFMWCCEVRVIPEIDDMLMTEAVWLGTVLETSDAAERRGRNATVVKKCL